MKAVALLFIFFTFFQSYAHSPVQIKKASSEKIYFVHLGLCWVSAAAGGLSLVAVSGGCSLVTVLCSSVQGLLCLQGTSFGSCSTQPQQSQFPGG